MKQPTFHRFFQSLISKVILIACMLTILDAMADLNRALDLTKGKKTRARALALCQRGVLLRKQGNDDDARAVFTEAAKLGSSFAKKQVGTVYNV